MNSHPYRYITAAFASKHEKQNIVSPYLTSLKISLVVSDVDTDVMGTFSGEIAREGTPKEVVLKKARMGIEVKELPFGIASQGSIGVDSIIPFITSNLEWMAWMNIERGIELVEFYRSLDIVATQMNLIKSEDIEEFFQKADFLNHALIVRGEGTNKILKGIKDCKRLQKANNSIPLGEKIIIESDLRSH